MGSYAGVCVCACCYVCVYVCIYMCVYVYTAVPVCERFANWTDLVSEGHFVRFTKDLSEIEHHHLGYEPNTKFQNLGYEKIISIRLKSAKLNKKHITMHLWIQTLPLQNLQ